MSKIKFADFFPHEKANCMLLLALVFVLIHQAFFLNWTNDDSFISYRYAENLSSGRGLVFNPGEKVEGFSNFLWVLLLAFFNIMGINPLISSKTISLFASLLLVFLVSRTGLAFGLSKLSSSLSALTLSFSTSLAYYSMSGLETVFYTFLLLLAVFMNEKYEKEKKEKYFYFLYGILLAAALTRPEGILFLVLSSLYHFLKKILTKKGIPLERILAAQILSFSFYVFLIILRYFYYAEILPNTFYAKPAGTFIEEGYNAFYANIRNAFFSGSFFLLPLFFLLIQKNFLKKFAYPLLFCLGQMIFLSYAGDWMAFGRFFLPILPLVIILIFSLLDLRGVSPEKSSSKSVLKFASLLVAILFAGFNIFQTTKAITNKDIYPYNVMNSTCLVPLGKWLNQKFPTQAVVALRRQGAIPYYSKLKSLDFLGLTEKRIAKNIYKEKDLLKRNQINASYILDQKPDLIILFSFLADDEGWVFDRSKPGERFYHLEYLLYKEAIKNGYTLLDCRSSGRKEKAYIFIYQEEYKGNFRKSKTNAF